MPDALTATQVQQAQHENRIRMAALRHALMDAVVAENQRRNAAPRVAVVGFSEYLPLKMEILGSSVELINRGPGGLSYTGCGNFPFPEFHLQAFTQLGVECFFWNGILVLCTQSRATGTFFL